MRRAAALARKLVAITPEMERFNAELDRRAEANFPVLSDMDNGYALMLNLAFLVSDEKRRAMIESRLGFFALSGQYILDSAYPGDFRVGRDGLVKARFIDPDYRKRMDTNVILECPQVAGSLDRRFRMCAGAATTIVSTTLQSAALSIFISVLAAVDRCRPGNTIDIDGSLDHQSVHGQLLGFHAEHRASRSNADAEIAFEQCREILFRPNVVLCLGLAPRSSRNPQISFTFRNCFGKADVPSKAREATPRLELEARRCPSPTISCRVREHRPRNPAVPTRRPLGRRRDLDFTFFQKFGNFAVGATIKRSSSPGKTRTSSDKKEISNMMLTVTEIAIDKGATAPLFIDWAKILRSKRYRSTAATSAAYAGQAPSDATDFARAEKAHRQARPRVA